MKICKELLSSFKLSKTINIQNINIYLLKVGKNNNIKNLKLLEEILEDNTVFVNELENEERVDLIKIFNSSNHNLLLLSGDILEGARQNRMIMESVIINPKNTYKVPVSCVERDRWSYKKNRNFYASDMKISPKIRESKDLLGNNNSNSIQSKIWEDIDNISKDKGVSSPTSNYCDFKVNNLDEEIKKFKRKINLKNFNAYFVEGIGKVFFEYFFSFNAAKRNLIKAIPGYLLDQDNISLDENKILNISTLKNSVWEKEKSVGDGISYTTHKENLGKTILFNNQIAHLYFYFS